MARPSVPILSKSSYNFFLFFLESTLFIVDSFFYMSKDGLATITKCQIAGDLNISPALFDALEPGRSPG